MSQAPCPGSHHVYTPALFPTIPPPNGDTLPEKVREQIQRVIDVYSTWQDERKDERCETIAIWLHAGMVIFANFKNQIKEVLKSTEEMRKTFQVEEKNFFLQYRRQVDTKKSETETLAEFNRRMNAEFRQTHTPLRNQQNFELKCQIYLLHIIETITQNVLSQVGKELDPYFSLKDVKKILL